jgi:hypothetical protein
MKAMTMRFRQAALVSCLLAGVGLIPVRGEAQDYIPATAAFNPSGSRFVCNGTDITSDHDLDRGNPEWKPIDLDSAHPVPSNMPRILEGFVQQPPSDEDQNSQAPAEVSEEELPWNHFTHDYTFKVVPDAGYQYLLSSWTRFKGLTVDLPGTSGEAQSECSLFGGSYQGGNSCQLAPPSTCPDGTQSDTCHHPWMEIEWENGSVMKVNDDDDRRWGSLPEFAWPAVGDRVWVEGRWIFDCGHTGVGGLDNISSYINAKDYVQFETEIHPPRALVTMRLNHTALGTEPDRTGSVQPASWLPVTGDPVPPNAGPTLVPTTEADIFVSGNGGGANDKCMLLADCGDSDHTGPLIPVNDFNYVFDIYPPGTDYGWLEANGTFKVFPPVADASLQYRIVDQSSELPLHTCGDDLSSCRTVSPRICLIGASTPPPPSDPASQTLVDTQHCPALAPGEQPTRLRVILPFAGTTANYFAQSILLGWDDVPDPAGHATPSVRTLKVTLDTFTVDQNGRCCTEADWRVFVDVGGQGRYISPLFDTKGGGIYEFTGGDNTCSGDPLDELGDNDCYNFTRTPWFVNVVDGTPIHIHVGGFDSSGVDGNFCRTYDLSDCSAGIHGYFDLAFENDNRIGTYEFDLPPTRDYAAPNPFQIPETKEEYQYTTAFRVEEVSPPTPPVSTLQIGDPHYNGFVSSLTPFELSSADSNAKGFQYRFHRQGAPLPTFASTPFPVHWTIATLPAGSQTLSLHLAGANAISDGPYDFQYSGQSFGHLLEPRHTQAVTLDSTPPAITINQPGATQYGRGGQIELDYSVSDGLGSGVKAVTPTMDGLTAQQFGTSLSSGQTIYLYSMPLGTHTFSVAAADNVDNSDMESVGFTITVTFDSLGGDVTSLQGLGCIDKLSQSLLAKIGAAQKLNSDGQTQAAVNTLAALTHEIQAQAAKHISTTCKDPNGRSFDPVQLLMEDAQYLQLIVAGQLSADPILGWVVNSAGAGIGGVTMSLLDASSTVIATTVTDATGFYYFAQASAIGLVVGANYAVVVTPASPYTTSTPASQAFTWSSSPVVGGFVLN